jgi:hypothetical protein
MNRFENLTLYYKNDDSYNIYLNISYSEHKYIENYIISSE